MRLRLEEISCYCYADHLILVSTSAAGLQKQLDALASFCGKRQLTVNPAREILWHCSAD